MMPPNAGFQRGIPARATFAIGTRTRPPTGSTPHHHHQFYPSQGASSQPTAGPGMGGSFFKRLIPSRFSKRYVNGTVYGFSCTSYV